jgi:hypothetical protein
MPSPDDPQQRLSPGNRPYKINARNHDNGDGRHHARLRHSGHAETLHETLKVIFVKLCVDEPGVQPGIAACKAEGCQQQEGKGRQHRYNGANGAQDEPNAAQGNIEGSSQLHGSNLKFGFLIISPVKGELAANSLYR